MGNSRKVTWEVDPELIPTPAVDLLVNDRPSPSVMFILQYCRSKEAPNYDSSQLSLSPSGLAQQLPSVPLSLICRVDEKTLLPRNLKQFGSKSNCGYGFQRHEVDTSST